MKLVNISLYTGMMSFKKIFRILMLFCKTALYQYYLLYKKSNMPIKIKI